MRETLSSSRNPQGMVLDPASVGPMHAPGRTFPKITLRTLCIPTCNRTEGATQSLTSYLQNFAAHGRTCEIVVTDDSPAHHTRKACRQTLAGLSRKFGNQIYYAGAEEKIRYAKRLIQGGEISPAVVKFALFDVTGCSIGSYGANRNALMLQTIGEPFVSVDDDTFCRIAAPQHLENTLSFHEPSPFSSSDPCSVWVYNDRSELLADLCFTDKDFLALHEELLGRDVRECFHQWPLSTDRAHGCAAGINAQGKVLVTFNGLAGDCAWPSPSNYLLLDPSSLRRLLTSDEAYSRACLSRNILRVSTSYGIARACSNSPGLFTGLDNRELLPPYMPVGRGEDIIYWNTISRIIPHCAFGHLPWALLHLPFEARQFWRGEMVRSSSGVALDIVVSTLIRSFVSSTSKPDSNMRALGEYLAGHGQLNARDFGGRLTELVAAEAGNFIQHLESIEAGHSDTPPQWRRDMQQFIQNAKEAFSRPEGSIPLDLIYNRTAEQARELTQRLIVQFGALLSSWPDIISAAKRLKKSGVILAPLLDVTE